MAKKKKKKINIEDILPHGITKLPITEAGMTEAEKRNLRQRKSNESD